MFAILGFVAFVIGAVLALVGQPVSHVLCAISIGGALLCLDAAFGIYPWRRPPA